MHINLTSGGVASAVSLFRLVERFPREEIVSLFCDTKMEDEDLYRFNADFARATGIPLTTIADGRDPWQVFFDEKYLGNSLVDPCSRILKRSISNRFIREQFTPENCTRYVGFYLDESDRLRTLTERLLPWKVESALHWKPAMCEADARRFLVEKGIRLPRLYALGFGHNNCGGFCIKAGHAHFERLLLTMPERYAYHEAKEQEIREYLQKDVSILRDRTDGKSKPLTLKAFRERVQAGLAVPGLFDGMTGCSCFADSDPA